MPDDYYVLQRSGEEIEELLDKAGSATGAVRYDAAQTLTDEQRAQARGNIEAQSGSLVQTTFDTKGWYRIATGSRRSGGILTVQHSDNNGGPSSLKLLVTSSEEGSSLKCIEYTNYSASAITNARIVSNASGLYCIDVYYNVDGLNTAAIDFISTGLDEAKGQVPVYIGADDTLPSGENLKVTMEYLNPPLVLGVEYRTTERFLGKPVYVKVVNCGDFVADKTVSWTDTLSEVIGIAGINVSSYRMTFPDSYISGDKIVLRGSDQWGGTIQARVQYIKNTD